jgi:hypothetical protein
MSIMINMSPEISNKVGQHKLHNTPDRLLFNHRAISQDDINQGSDSNFFSHFNA